MGCAVTRINCVPVFELHGKHLVAEYRELPRIYALSYKAHKRGEQPEDHPDDYRLGKGHVKFFYSRLLYVRARQAELIAEMLRRGFRPTFLTLPDLDLWPRSWQRNWEPEPRHHEINWQRIKENLSETR